MLHKNDNTTQFKINFKYIWISYTKYKIGAESKQRKQSSVTKTYIFVMCKNL